MLKKLQDTSSLLLAIFNNINYLVITTSKDGIITSFNRKAEQMLGYEASELIGKHTPAIFHYPPEILDRATQFSNELNIALEPGFEVFVIKSKLGFPNEYEWTYIAKNGAHIPVLLSVTSLHDNDGLLIGYVGISRDITAEKETYEQFIHSKQLLNEAQNLAKVGSWSLDLTQNYLEWSDEIYRIFEIDPIKFNPSYEGFLNAIHPEDVEIVQEAFSQSVQNQTPYSITHRLLMSDGRVKYVVENGITTYSDEGTSLFSHGTVQDITEIKVLQEELNLHNQELEAILETTRDGIAIVDMDSNFLYVNNAYLKMSGFTKEELMGKTFVGFSVPEDSARLALRLKEVVDKGFIQNIEKTCIVANGKRVKLNISMALMPDKQRILISTKDIAEAKALEKKLHDYIALVDEHIITSSTDVKGNIVYASKAFCRISQYSEEELIGKNHRIIRHPDMPASLYDELWKTITMDKSWAGEIKNIAKDGSFYWVYAAIAPTWDEDGKKVGYTAIRQDITDKKRIEELSITDRLTGLYNRLKLDEVFMYELVQSKRFHAPLSIILLDIDHFKHVNDTYGHQVGDQVLQHIANILRSIGRKADTIGRWGGEEFLIVLPQTDRDGAIKMGEKIRLGVEDYSFPVIGKKTASFGIAEFQEEDNQSTLVERADRALYRAKNEGRNRVAG
ncbi:MAG: PAS domain S-box protein [Sulfuricurvum sp.]|nr:PAS domain S-box protein [Sulfuricurvum sp.]